MPEPPFFSVVRGRLDSFETAAVTVVLAALARRSRSGPPSALGALGALGAVGAVRAVRAPGAGGPWRSASGGFQPPSSWRGPR